MLVGNSSIEQKVIQLIERMEIPVTIKFVAASLNLTWATTRAILFSLVAEGRIAGQKTTRSWIFSKKVSASS